MTGDTLHTGLYPQSERMQGFAADLVYVKGEEFAYVGLPQNPKDQKDQSPGQRQLSQSAHPDEQDADNQKVAWLFYRNSSSVRLCWELEEPKGPKGPSQSAHPEQGRICGQPRYVRGRRHLRYRGTSLKEPPPLQDPTVSLWLGTYGEPWELGVCYERGTPVTTDPPS